MSEDKKKIYFIVSVAGTAFAIFVFWLAMLPNEFSDIGQEKSKTSALIVVEAKDLWKTLREAFKKE